MRVAFVLPGLDFGGAERMVEELALAVHAAGGQAIVVATTRGGPLAERIALAGVPVEVLGLASPVDARVALRLRRILRAFRPTVVHSHLAVADIAAAAAGASPHWTTLHNPGVQLDPWKKRLWQLALARTHRRFAVAEHIRRRFGPAEVIRPSFVDPAPAVGLDQRAARRAEVRLDSGLEAEAMSELWTKPLAELQSKPWIISLGRRGWVKGVDVMAAASERLPRTLRWLHFGPGAAPEPAGRIEWRPPRADVEALLAAADVFVQASRSEGLPQATLEALWTPVPVVVTAVGGTRELVGPDGLYVPVGDPEALAAAIMRVLQTPTLSGERSRRARQRLEAENLTRRGMLDAYVEAYGRA